MSRRHKERINQAQKDAMMLAVWKAQGIIPSRRYAAIYGMSQNRFENAVALLKLARIIVNHRTWASEDLSVIKFQLSNATRKALEDPALYYLRLSNHAKM
jgi:hypothetical protein